MDELVYKAICQDRPARLEAFLRQGGDPNMWLEDATRISGKSFLHVCCEKGRIRCVKVLLEYGAQIDIQGSLGQTPLMLCIMTEYFDIAELLMNNNTDIIDQQDTNGNTPLHIAIGNDSVEAVELLLRYNANVNIPNSNGITPMMKMCSFKEAENMPKIVTMLMETGAQYDYRDFRSHRTALQLAVTSKNFETVQILLTAGADPNTIDSGGRTPLTNVMWQNFRNYDATKYIDPDVMTIIHMLVLSGSDLNLSTREFSNPLVMALYFKCAPLVRYLLENGASQKGKFFGGITPLCHAANKKDIDSMKELLNWSCDFYTKARVFKRNYDVYLDPFELAIDQGCPEMALLLAQVGYNVTRINYLTDWAIDPPACLKERQDILERLRLSALEPPMLFDLSVMCIRGRLQDNLESKANRLPLPKLLIEDIKLKGLLC